MTLVDPRMLWLDRTCWAEPVTPFCRRMGRTYRARLWLALSSHTTAQRIQIFRHVQRFFFEIARCRRNFVNGFCRLFQFYVLTICACI